MKSRRGVKLLKIVPYNKCNSVLKSTYLTQHGEHFSSETHIVTFQPFSAVTPSKVMAVQTSSISTTVYGKQTNKYIYAMSLQQLRTSDINLNPTHHYVDRMKCDSGDMLLSFITFPCAGSSVLFLLIVCK